MTFEDYRQLAIPLRDAKWFLEEQKRKREEELIRETKYFREHDEEREFLLRLTFDITDKDFEYFTEYLMLEFYKLEKYKVTGGLHDGGEDVVGYDKK